MTNVPKNISIFHWIELISLGINRMSIDNHRMTCGKRGKNLSQPINSPFIAMNLVVCMCAVQACCTCAYESMSEAISANAHLVGFNSWQFWTWEWQLQQCLGILARLKFQILHLTRLGMHYPNLLLACMLMYWANPCTIHPPSCCQNLTHIKQWTTMINPYEVFLSCKHIHFQHEWAIHDHTWLLYTNHKDIKTLHCHFETLVHNIFMHPCCFKFCIH